MVKGTSRFSTRAGLAAGRRHAIKKGEIASIDFSRDITRTSHYLEALVPQDSLLGQNTDRLKLYEEVLNDDQVKSAWEKRQKELISKEWTVLPGTTPGLAKGGGHENNKAEETAEELKAQLTSIGWNQVTEHMHHGVFFGFAVAELIYEVSGRPISMARGRPAANPARFPSQQRVIIKDIKTRNPRRFAFGHDGQPRLKTRERWLDGCELPERKFWHYHYGSHHGDDPYGRGLAHWLYWPARFKREGLVFWNEFLDKYGAPFVVGKYPNGTSDKDQDKLLQACMAVRRDMGIAIPDGMMIELMQSNSRGQVTHESLYNAMNNAILKLILGQTMTTEDGSSRSQSETHAGQQTMIIESDAALIDESFNKGPVRWWMDWNYGIEMPAPRIVRLFEEAEDKQAHAQTILTMKQAGWSAPQEQIDTVFGEGWQKQNIDSAPPVFMPPGRPEANPGRSDTKTTEFQEGDSARDTSDDITDEAEVGIDAATSEWIDIIKAVLDDSDSPEEAQAKLLMAYKDIDPTKLAEMLGQANALADLRGRDEAGEPPVANA